MRTVCLKAGVLSIPKTDPTISGPKSPTTTKNAIHVPIRNPIMHNSAVNFPVDPNTWKAKTTNTNCDSKT